MEHRIDPVFMRIPCALGIPARIRSLPQVGYRTIQELLLQHGYRPGTQPLAMEQ